MKNNFSETRIRVVEAYNKLCKILNQNNIGCGPMGFYSGYIKSEMAELEKRMFELISLDVKKCTIEPIDLPVASFDEESMLPF